MTLKEKHKQFVVKSFACFMKLTDIVDAFIEEFEYELPTPELPEMTNVDEFLSQPLSDEWIHIRAQFIARYTKEHAKTFDAEYGKDADKKLNEGALAAFKEKLKSQCMESYKEQLKETVTEHEKQLRQELFNQFRRLDINHRQFPDKYRDLFNQTRDEFCASYRTLNLTTATNIAQELETLYGYQKQCIFQAEYPEEATKHVTLAHQILKTLVACNAINTEQDIVDITPQDPEALEEKK